jgi:hypothetical protein
MSYQILISARGSELAKKKLPPRLLQYQEISGSPMGWFEAGAASKVGEEHES